MSNKWRYGCPDCGSTLIHKLKIRKEYRCNHCMSHFDSPVDKMIKGGD